MPSLPTITYPPLPWPLPNFAWRAVETNSLALLQRTIAGGRNPAAYGQRTFAGSKHGGCSNVIRKLFGGQTATLKRTTNTVYSTDDKVGHIVHGSVCSTFITEQKDISRLKIIRV